MKALKLHMSVKEVAERLEEDNFRKVEKGEQHETLGWGWGGEVRPLGQGRGGDCVEEREYIFLSSFSIGRRRRRRRRSVLALLFHLHIPCCVFSSYFFSPLLLKRPLSCCFMY